MAGLLLFEGSEANLGIRMSWKPNVTVHLPCISIPAPQTSHQTSSSKSSARADSHAATARTSVEIWQLVPVCACVHVCCVRVFRIQTVCETSYSSQHWLCVWPVSHWEPHCVLQATAMSEAEPCGCILGVCRGNHFYKQKKKIKNNSQTHNTCTHVNTLYTGALHCMNIHLQLWWAVTCFPGKA